MQKQKRLLASVLGVITLTMSSATFAGVVPLENRLAAWDDYGTATVNFTDIDVKYTNGKTKRGVTDDTVFFAQSSNTSQFELFAPTEGYGTGPNDQFVPFGSGVGFDGALIIDAKISSRGILRSGSTFGIYSNDAMFGTDYTTTYGCNKQGNACSEGQLVYGGDLTAFGWSGGQGLLEFEISNLAGWAHDQWGTTGATEHIMLDVGGFTLNDVSSVKSFTATADGFAVVPVPAAAWLFGSGLLGLAGIARRKRSQL